MQLIIHTQPPFDTIQYFFSLQTSFFSLQNQCIYRLIPCAVFFRYSFSIWNVIQFRWLKLLNPLLLFVNSKWKIELASLYCMCVCVLAVILLKMRHKSSNVKVKRRISHWTTMKNFSTIHAIPICAVVVVLKAILSTSKFAYTSDDDRLHFATSIVKYCHAQTIPCHAQLVFPSFIFIRRPSKYS